MAFFIRSEAVEKASEIEAAAAEVTIHSFRFHRPCV
jgi:hypothetical protein